MDRSPEAPLVLAVDLARLERGEVARARPWRRDDALGQVGAWSGAALALALHQVAARAGRPPPFVVAAGDAVRRGLPTAARATIAARSPLTGRYAEGQVGSDLGRRLARVADAIAIEGRTRLPGAVLVVDGAGCARLVARPELAGLSADRAHAALEAAFGACASLRVGPAGERGVPFATLAAGAPPASSVGRGGLGAVLGEHGLKAIVVTAEPVGDAPDGGAIARLLARSPRLAARAAGGTLEVADALAARCEAAPEVTPALVTSAAAPVGPGPGHGAARPLAERKGCAGCPTPCGWVFETRGPDEPDLVGARFGALDAFAAALGATRGEPARGHQRAGPARGDPTSAGNRLDDRLALLAACDAAGLDAKEAGALLTLECLAHERGSLAGTTPRGDVVALRDRISALGRGERAKGATERAAELGLGAELSAAGGEAVAPGTLLAGWLGARASARGADPMRSFAFLFDVAVHERAAELVAPLPLPRGALDPRSPVAKGRLTWWHENLAAALDATGFCLFSAAGLLADGVAGLDALARAVAPPSVLGLDRSPGRALQAAGASLAVLQRDLNERWGASGETGLPEPARAAIEHPQAWPEYRALRGLDARGRLRPEALARVARAELLDLGLPLEDGGPGSAADGPGPAADGAGAYACAPGAPARSGADRPRVLGSVELTLSGPLARVLGPRMRLEVALPAPLAEVAAELARCRPEAARHLWRAGELVPSAWRAGRRLEPVDRVEHGDALTLVTALSGG